MKEPAIPTTVRSVSVHEGPGQPVRRAAGLCPIWTEGDFALPAFVPVEGEALTIGRGDINALALPHDQAASRVHARIARRGEELVLSDVSSTNGTWVFGARVREHVLRDHDVIRIGNTLLRFAASELDGLTASVSGPLPDQIVGGARTKALARDVVRVARSDLSLMLRGESGTGKEVFAQLVHEHSGRRGRFVPVNCAALPATLIESELFGYKKGAFSGADQDKVGLVRSADRGTLFLDEIGDMPLEAQAKLLRVLQEREVRPVGGTSAERVDLRVVCATHRDLERMVREGKFRGDLMARLAQFIVTIPPLRERREDLAPLVRHFLRELGRDDLRLSVEWMEALSRLELPYNVRELGSIVKVAATLSTGTTLSVAHLPNAAQRSWADDTRPLSPRDPGQTLRSPSRKSPSPAPSKDELEQVLQKHAGNISAVSRELGRDRVQIHRWLRRYGIEVTHLRG